MRIDRVYVLANPKDLHFTRCCITSIRQWYPGIPIALVKDGNYDTSDLERYWGVSIFDAPKKYYGLGMSRFEPLFRPTRERCFILDSDIVLAGPILDELEMYGEDFVVEGSNYPEQDIKAYYYDPEVLSALYPGFQFPGYVFNTGQMVATTGILKREFFTPFMSFDEPPRVIREDVFAAFDQGVLNFVLHQKAHEGLLTIRRHVFMRWPQAMEPTEVDVDRLQDGDGYPFLLHWAGLKHPKITDNAMSHVLTHFERVYLRKTLPKKMKDRAALNFAPQDF